MIGFSIWLRRTTARTAFPAMVAVTMVVLFSRSGWAWDLGHAVSWASSSTMLLGPLSAGIAAFDMWRQRGPALRSIEMSATQGWLGVLMLTLTVWLYAVAAWGAAAGLALLVGVIRYDAGGLGIWWPVLIQAPAALLAATALGAVIGALVRGVGAAPLAVGAVYATTMAADLVLGTRSVLAVEGATMSLVGLAPRGDVVAATIALDLAIGAALGALLVHREHGRSRSVAVGVGAASIAAAACATALVVLDVREAQLQENATERVCVAGAVEVCGPREGLAIYRVAQKSLTAGVHQLETIGLTIEQRAYNHAASVDATSGVLSVDTSLLARTGLDAWDVASTLSTPTLCEEYFGADPPTELLDGQWTLAAWIADALSNPTDVDPGERAAAQETLAALARCAPDEIPQWTYTPAELRDAG